MFVRAVHLCVRERYVKWEVQGDDFVAATLATSNHNILI